MNRWYKIGDLTSKSKRINIIVKLVAKSEPRYAKGYKIVTFTGSDPTGKIAIPLWNEDSEKVKVGDVIEIQNGYVSVFRGQMQLNVGRFGSFQVITPPAEFITNLESSPSSSHDEHEPDTELVDVEQLRVRTKRLRLCVFIKRKVEERTVRTRIDGKNHRVATFLVGDATGCIYLNLWDEWIDLVEVGTSVIIEHGYVRTFRGQRFLNIARRGSITPCETDVKFNSDNNLSEVMIA